MSGTTILNTAITFDCADARHLASFWAALVGGTLAADPSSEFAAVQRPGAVDLNFAQVPEAKTSKNRVHLDLSVPDLSQAVAHARELGAEVGTSHDDWTVLRDPEGNEFCLVRS